MELTPDFKEFIELLNANKVNYLVTGGYAVALYGYQRHTGDIVFWVENSPENATNIEKALHQFGFGSLDIDREDFLKPDFIVQLGFPPNRIDIITGISGMTFEECWRKKNPITIDGMNVNFISLSHLLVNKKASGRKKDLLDYDQLFKLRGKRK